MKQYGNTKLPRRRFLQQLMVLGGATGAGAVILNTGQANAAVSQAANPATQTAPEAKGYRLTEHIRTYYEKAQF
jgi:hypothetical protein